MSTFSERQGITKSINLDPTVMSVAMKNRIWNTIQDYIDDGFHGNKDQVIEYIWDRFFKENKNTLEGQTSYI